MLMDHEAPYDISNQHCRKCKETVFMKWSEKHKCCLAKSAYLRLVSSNVSLAGGPPYRCLFCRSRPFSSRSELTVHLLAYHRPQRQPGVCGLCSFTFQEPPPQPPPAIATPPANADEATLREHELNLKKAMGEQMCKFESAEVAPGLLELDAHCAKTHVPAYQLLLRQKLQTEFQLREPFACVMCGQIFHSNVEYHGHILCRHGTDEPEAIAELANLWTSQELLMDATDTNQVCTTCWEVLPNPMQLQAHVLNHARVLHAQALDFKKTFEPIPEPLNEDFSMEAIAAAQAAEAAAKTDTSKSGSKSKSASKGKKK
ncbi:unnamed protein product [Dibothriocephalus latus]|uniref:C2H2-type domain-containing protein n=1 Tax=Dibothriocephalus latus TaxID=60516 RepID=A0A3P7NYT3_DIBLA|nr:unnamed protein product [Dibothriocephalus latus]